MGDQFGLWLKKHIKHLGTLGPVVEWDVGDVVLVAMFENGHTDLLDAFGTTIPTPAMNFRCQATRS